MFRALTFAAALSLCACGTAFAGDEEGEKSMTIGDIAPPVEIEHWVKGVEMDRRGNFEPVTEFGDGKVYVLEFWATWCGPCVGGMPHLSELQEQYADYDVTIIGVSNETLPKVVDFLFKTNKSDGKLQNDRTQYTLATDPDQSVWNEYFRAAGQKGIPCAFVIGKKGHVEWIGHPMRMDEPLAAVVHDEWDRDAFKAKWETGRIKEKETESVQKKLAEAQKNKDWDQVVKIIDGQIAKTPDNANLHMQKFMVLLVYADKPDEAYKLGHKMVEASWDDQMALNQIAWTIADDPSISKRDLDLAMKAAKRANELTKSKDPAILDTLARVHYEKGDLKKAIKWQQKAVDNAGDNQMGEEIRKTLAKYEKEFGEPA